jgi:hypothetical protein
MAQERLAMRRSVRRSSELVVPVKNAKLTVTGRLWSKVAELPGRRAGMERCTDQIT